jgi:membrane protease YdiL (CAAX protease family)
MAKGVSQDSRSDCIFNRSYALILLLAVIVFTHLPTLILRAFWIRDGVSENDIVIHVLLAGLQSYLMLLCPFVLLRTMPAQSSFDRIWLRWSRSEIVRLPFLVLGVVVIVIAFYALVRILDRPTATLFFQCSHGPAFWTWFVIRITLISPFAEEIFWRGYVQSTLSRAVGSRPAILIQALLFGLSHSGFANILRASSIGIVFGIWCDKRKTLLPVLILHILNNVAAFAVRWPNWARLIFG